MANYIITLWDSYDCCVPADAFEIRANSEQEAETKAAKLVHNTPEWAGCDWTVELALSPHAEF